MAALLLFVQFGLGFAVRNGAKAAGPAAIGTPIATAPTHFRPAIRDRRTRRSRRRRARGLQGRTSSKWTASAVVFEAQKSLLSDTILIKEIVIADPVVSYELSGLNHNIGAILKKLEGAGDKADKPEEEADEDPGKKVVIERFVFKGAKIRIASTALGGKGAVIPMPAIELHDIGKKSGGATSLEVLAAVLGSVAQGVLGAVKTPHSLGGMALTPSAIGDAALARGTRRQAAVKAAGAVGDAALGAPDAQARRR